MYSVRVLKVNSPDDAVRQFAALHFDLETLNRITHKMANNYLLIESISLSEADVLCRELQSLGGEALRSVKSVDCTGSSVRVVLTGTDQLFTKLSQRLSQLTSPLQELSVIIAELPELQSRRPARWNIGARTLELACRPHVMGILNITPDSFSDGSLYIDAEKALERALEMEAEGADSIDVGGESTRPYSAPVSETEELKRVLPVLKKLAGRLKIPVSIDTYKSSVAREAIYCGAEIVNDISGFSFDNKMAEVVAAAKTGVILTHTRGTPAEMQNNTDYPSLIPEIFTFLRQAISAAEASGIAAHNIVIDPGIGFGKSIRGNLEILRRLEEFTLLGRPILVGTSRKSFIGSILQRETGDRVFGTAATNALAIANGASLIRVHDVKAMRDVADMTMAVVQGQQLTDIIKTAG
jgi:dihydropteroate synthase